MADDHGRPATRLLGVAAILAVAWGARFLAPTAQPAEHVVGASGPGIVHYVDTEGWYRRTPDEVAVVSPFDLSLESLPLGLPYDIGEWHGIDRTPDPGVREWFEDPDVMIERTYTRQPDELIWLSAFGSRGNKSFFLFEHTPETCYPLSGWQVREMEARRIDLGPRPMTVNFGRAVNASGSELAFMFAYVWADPSRDPERGVVSLRIGSLASKGEAFEEAERRLLNEFLPSIFTTTLSWTSF